MSHMELPTTKTRRLATHLTNRVWRPTDSDGLEATGYCFECVCETQGVGGLEFLTPFVLSIYIYVHVGLYR